ncbi:MAG: YbhB/YbcL family Raf kinase inhibitor-like protein [Candidatus Kaiserbacteria bacterium]|nr:YbhB/YbcL family Raf kinase inhibitor-like protein [Candidatus Kaiserbacteria bacterium]
MRYAYMLMGLSTIILSVGAFFAFSHKVDAPTETILSNSEHMPFTLSTPAFKEGESIPSKYTCDGDNVSPELHFENVPEGTKSFVLVMDDPDIPDSVKTARGIEVFDHWVLYNIPSTTRVLEEGEAVGNSGLNSRGTEGYVGSCPPDREHRYFFRLYALSGTLNFIKAPTLREVEEAVQGMSLGKATLMGRYERIQKPQ